MERVLSEPGAIVRAVLAVVAAAVLGGLTGDPLAWVMMSVGAFICGIGTLLALSTQRERNSLVCVHYRQEFGRDRVYLLRVLPPQESNGRAMLAGTLMAPPLFAEDMTHARFSELLAQGWRIKSTRLSATFDWPHFIEQYGSGTVLLFGVDEKGVLRVVSAHREVEPRPGWLVIALVPAE